MNILRIHKPMFLPVAAVASLAVLASGASAQDDERLSLDIKPQNADSALVTLAKSSGVQIILADGAGADAEVEGLKGEYGSTRTPFGETLGTSGINLRGLGTRSSLVLINNHRKARSSLDVQDLLTDNFALKATNGESFLTPLSSQLYGTVTILDATNNPYANPFFFSPVPPYSRFVALWGSNPSLQPQTASTTTVTLEYSPAGIQGLDIAVTWSDFAYDNFIATPSAIPDEDLVANFERLPQIFILGDTDTIIYR